MTAIDDPLLTRHGRAARRLAALLLNHDEDTRLPRLRDLAEELGVGNGTAQAALRLLEESGAIETVARGHLGTFLLRTDRTTLWRLTGLGTLLAAMPLPHSPRHEGLATGLRAAFEETGAPFAITFQRGAASRVAALLEGEVDLAVLSRFAADQLMAEHPLELLADLGRGSYAGAHGLILRHGVELDFSGLRVAIDYDSEDLRTLTERTFADRSDVHWVETSPVGLRDLFERGDVDAAVWNLDEARQRLGPAVAVLPLADEATRGVAPGNSSATVVGRSGSSRALETVRPALDLSAVTAVQGEVLRGERIPSY